MGFLPNLLQGSHSFFKGHNTKWARRQQNNRYFIHRDRLHTIRPVVNTDPPKAFHILSKRLLRAQRRISGMDSYGSGRSIVTVPDTESLKDWTACRQQRPPAPACIEHLISVEDLNQSLSELERDASRSPRHDVQLPDLSSSQLVEKVEELERSLASDLGPADAAAHQRWTRERSSRRSRGKEAAGRTPIPAERSAPPAAMGAGSAPDLRLNQTTEAAGDHWISRRKEIRDASLEQMTQYVVINNEKVPVVIKQGAVQLLEQTVRDVKLIEPFRPQERQRMDERAQIDLRTDEKTSMECSEQNQEDMKRKHSTKYNKICETKCHVPEEDFETNYLSQEQDSPTFEENDSQIFSIEQGPVDDEKELQALEKELSMMTNTENRRIQEERRAAKKIRRSQALKETDKTGYKVKGFRILQSISRDDGVVLEVKGIPKRTQELSQVNPESKQQTAERHNKSTSKANTTSNVEESPQKESEVKRRIKTRSRSSKQTQRHNSQENRSDTDLEIAERKDRIEKLVEINEQRKHSPRDQPIKIFFKKMHKKPQINIVEVAERSTQTVQCSKSETMTTRPSRTSQSQNARGRDMHPHSAPHSRSKSEHAMSRNDTGSVARRLDKLNRTRKDPGISSDPTLTRGSRDSRQSVVRHGATKSDTRVLRQRRRSPSPTARKPLEPLQKAPKQASSPGRQVSPAGRQAAARRSTGTASPAQQGGPARGERQDRGVAAAQARLGSPPRRKAAQRDSRAAQSRTVTITSAAPTSRGGGRGKPAETAAAAARPRPPPETARRQPLSRPREPAKRTAVAPQPESETAIVTTPGGSSMARRSSRAACDMCTSGGPPRSRAERVRRVVRSVAAAIDGSSPRSAQRPSGGGGQPRSGHRRHQLLSRIDALAAPRRRFGDHGDNRVLSTHSGCQKQPGAGETYEKAMRGASCRSCNIVRSPSPFTSNPFAFLDIEADGRPLGRLKILLRADLAPRTVENFRSLCTGEYGFGYKGTLFHRVIPRFVCQGGDVTFGGRNKQAPLSIYNRLFEDESFEMSHSEPGVVSMVNNGANTNGTQFFICTAKISWLDGRNVAFGLVTEGLQVVRKMEALGTSQGVPLKRIVIHKCGEIINDV